MQPSQAAAQPALPAQQQDAAGALPRLGLSVALGRPGESSLESHEQAGRGLRAELAERLAASLPAVSPRCA